MPSENKQKIVPPIPSVTNDKTSPDCDSDKTGTDVNSDQTQIGECDEDQNKNKFDKPKREKDPDRTGIDTNSDKTKKENKSN